MIQITLVDIKMPLVGIKGIDVLVDGEKRCSIRFGEVVCLEVNPGERIVQIHLHGTLDRKSGTFQVLVAEGGQVAIEAKYSRMWGNFKLRQL
jgi:hypothetical protein